jgi:hypothetical protein
MIWATSKSSGFYFRCDHPNCAAQFSEDSYDLADNPTRTLRKHGEAGWTKQGGTAGWPERIYCPKHKANPPTKPLHHFGAT